MTDEVIFDNTDHFTFFAVETNISETSIVYIKESDKTMKSLQQVGVFSNFVFQATAPTDTSLVWVQNDVDPGIVRVHNGVEWVPATFEQIFSGVVPRGDWALGANYVINNLVFNGNNSYLCIQAHTSTATDEPGVGVNTATFWAPLASAAVGVSGPGSSVNNNIATFDGVAGDTLQDSGVSISDVGDLSGPASAVDANIAVFDGVTGKLLRDSGSAISDLGAGDVNGPASSIDNRLVRFNGATGKIIQQGNATLSDSGIIDAAGFTVGGSSVGGIVAQSVSARHTPDFSTSSRIPLDNSVPTSSEGAQLVSVNITPASSSSRFLISVSIPQISGNDSASPGTPVIPIVTIFRGSTCISAGTADMLAADDALNATSYSINFVDDPNTSSLITYSVRIGSQTAGFLIRVNEDRTGSSLFGSAVFASITVTEFTS